MNKSNLLSDSVRVPSPGGSDGASRRRTRLKGIFGNIWGSSSSEPMDQRSAAAREAARDASSELDAGFTFVSTQFDVVQASVADFSSSEPEEELCDLSRQPSLHLTHPIPAIPPPADTYLAEKFQHTPLENKAPTVRLIQILPDLAPSGHVQCIIHHTLINDRPYDCLSYEWGAEQSGGHIFLNGRLMAVRENLLAFLSEAAQSYHSINLWIDALCINQEDEVERSYQVRQMGVIYTNARQVLVWLGSDARTSSILSALSKPSAEREESGRLQEHEDMIYLGQNSYWSRAWITQEVSLAKSLLLMAKGAAVDELKLPYSARFRMTHFGGTRQKDPQEENLLALLHKFRSQKCHVKRDTVYSLLALCRDGPNVKVDYTTSDSGVMQSILDACKEHLCFCSASIIASALDLNVIIDSPATGIIVHNAKYFQHHESTGFTKCSDCGSTMPHDFLPSGFSVCLRNLCPGMLFHIFWYDIDGSKARLCVVDGFNRTKYMSTTARVAGFPNGISSLDVVKTCNLRLPMTFLVDLGRGTWNESYPSELDKHLEIEKGFMSLCHSSRNLPPGPVVWVEDRPSPETN